MKISIFLENNLFSLDRLNSCALYGVTAREKLMEQAVTEIAYGRFSVVATLGQTTIVRCARVYREARPEMVAGKLGKMMAEHPTLLQRDTSKSSTSGSRQLLVTILDRNADLITPVQYCSTYQAFLDDVLQHKANRVDFSVFPPDGSLIYKKPLSKRYDLDPDEDRFDSQVPALFPSDSREWVGIGLNDADLATAVDAQQQLELHTSLLQAVTQVAAKDVPRFFELEYKLATGSYKNDPEKAAKDVSAMMAGVDQAGGVYD